MGAVQAQDYLYSLWAIGLRMQNATATDVEQAIVDRTILRTWPMRGTIHLVPAEDAA
jgi:Winged helix DNA-binding domain